MRWCRQTFVSFSQSLETGGVEGGWMHTASDKVALTQKPVLEADLTASARRLESTNCLLWLMMGTQVDWSAGWSNRVSPKNMSLFFIFSCIVTLCITYELRCCFSMQMSNFLNIFCAAVATAQQVPLTRALDGLSKNYGMGLLFRAVHYLPIVSGTNFRRNLKFTCILQAFNRRGSKLLALLAL
jgi:hypothetical protein